MPLPPLTLAAGPLPQRGRAWRLWSTRCCRKAFSRADKGVFAVADAPRWEAMDLLISPEPFDFVQRRPLAPLDEIERFVRVIHDDRPVMADGAS